MRDHWDRAKLNYLYKEMHILSSVVGFLKLGGFDFTVKNKQTNQGEEACKFDCRQNKTLLSVNHDRKTFLPVNSA